MTIQQTQLDIRSAGSRSAHEYYVRANLDAEAISPDVLSDAFLNLYDFVAETGSAIAHERIIMPPGCHELVSRAWQTVSRGRHDGVAPCFLAADTGQRELAIQLHAIAPIDPPSILTLDGRPAARLFRAPGMRWCIGSGILPTARVEPAAQADSMFRRARALLEQAGMTLHDVARTWIFMREILDWYGPFNGARNALFIEDGLLIPGKQGDVPASTGIGVAPATPFACIMDFIAATGHQECIQRHQAAGKQRAAYEYGSAFARAANVATPAGFTNFVSGTAAIDAAGNTCFPDDAEGQIRMTLDNVIAVLADLQCESDDVVAVIAYCKTPEVETVFRRLFMDTLPWPWVVVLADVCRDDLLFEIEATAIPSSRQLRPRF
ncbi:MAG: Rid family hydrolase [Tepidisphaeraceae bacterium]|jgi:enamine deaminase RidA (YjgF/YER057c/UK114 family)